MATPIYVPHGYKTLQMHGFPIQTWETPILMGQPLHKRGRGWLTSHCSFVSICQEFLGVLTTHDAHRHTVPPHAVHTCNCVVLHRMAHAK